MIDLDDLEKNSVYVVDAANFSVAIWDGEKFIGGVEEFGEVLPSEEWYYTEGFPKGTVKPLRKLDVVRFPLPIGHAGVYALYLATTIFEGDYHG